MTLGWGEEISKALEGVTGTFVEGVPGLDPERLHRRVLLAEERLDVYIDRIMADVETHVISVGRVRIACDTLTRLVRGLKRTDRERRECCVDLRVKKWGGVRAHL